MVIPPEAIGGPAMWKVAALVTTMLTLESVGWAILIRLNPAAVVMFVLPEMVAVVAATLMPSQVAETPEAMVAVGVKMKFPTDVSNCRASVLYCEDRNISESPESPSPE